MLTRLINFIYPYTPLWHNRIIGILISVFVIFTTSCSHLIIPPDTLLSESPDIESKTELTYPEDFFLISGEPIDLAALDEPIELFNYISANGPERLLDYGIVMILTLDYAGEEHDIEIGYKDERFVTSENISVGSTKEDVLEAYQQYGIVNAVKGYGRIIGQNSDAELELFLKKGIMEYSMEQFGGYRWLWLVKALADSEDNINTNDFLYVDNGTPEGIEQFGGLSAWIFVFDDFEVVKMILLTYPTSG